MDWDFDVKTAGLIPRSRLGKIPSHLRLNHECCYFLHDECVRVLSEYEGARAHLVSFKFRSKSEERKFRDIADTRDAIEALEKIGRRRAARRVILNTVTMALVSDCLHHVFEALKCFEKRKVVVGFNLLRKPLKQNLLYLAWLLGDEGEFYKEFMSGDSERLSQRALGNIRAGIFEKAIAAISVTMPLDAPSLQSIIYDRKNPYGFELLFEHAVHLITVERLELRTAPQNFNFIFKNYEDDDTYECIYAWLPYLLFFMSHVVVRLFNRMHRMDRGSLRAFETRSRMAVSLLARETTKVIQTELKSLLTEAACAFCNVRLTITPSNAAKIVLTDSFRCNVCRKKNLFPFSWML